jgi:hypothetical protein
MNGWNVTMVELVELVELGQHWHGRASWAADVGQEDGGGIGRYWGMQTRWTR